MKHKTKPAGNNEQTLSADQVKSMEALKRYLCSLAYVPGARGSKTVRVDACRNCVSQCAYGREYARRYDEQQKEEEEMAVKRAACEMTLQEQLETKMQECAELAKANAAVARHAEELEQKLADAGRRMAEDHIEIETQKLHIMRLKARIYDMEHAED